MNEWSCRARSVTGAAEWHEPLASCRSCSGVAVVVLLFTMAGGLLTAGGARGQGLDLDILRDSQLDRREAATRAQRSIVALRLKKMLAEAKKAGQAAATPDFTFQLTAPLFYNSNPDAVSSGGSGTIEGNPDLLLKWAKTLGMEQRQWKLSGFADASIDRFAHSMSADGDSTAVNTQLQFISEGYDQDFLPSLGFTETISFQPTFAHSVSSFHDITLRFDKMLNIDAQPKRLSPISEDTSSAAVWSIDLVGSVARRIGDQGTTSRTVIKASPSLTYNPTMDTGRGLVDGTAAQWSISLSCTAERLISDEQGGVSRRDWYLQPLFTVTYMPALGKFPGEGEYREDKNRSVYGMPTVTLQVAYTRLISTLATAEFKQWQIGPALVLQWTF